MWSGNVKAFNMITNKNEAKTMTKHISSNCKCKLNSITGNSKKKWNNKRCQCEYKNYHTFKIYYTWNPSTCTCENSKYLKGITDISVMECNDKLLWKKN